MSRFSAAALWFASSLALLACSSSDGSGGPAQTWFGSYAHAICTGIAPCCKAEGQAHDPAACEQFYDYLGNAGLQHSLDNGGHFDQTAADACLSQLQGWYDGCTGASSGPDVCQRVVDGTVAPGGACQTDFDCKLPDQGTVGCLLGSGSGSHGTCVQHLPAEEGKPCGNDTGQSTVYDCSSDPAFACDYNSNTCTKKLAVGAACDSGTCVDDASCSYDAQTGGSTCQPLAALGATCTGYGSCVSDAYCDGTTCAAKLAAGAPCTGDECLGYCDSTTGTCAGNSSGSGGYLCVTSN